MRSSVGQEPSEGEPVEVVVPVVVVGLVVVRLLGVGRRVPLRDRIEVGCVEGAGEERPPGCLLDPDRLREVDPVEERMHLDLVRSALATPQPRFGLAAEAGDEVSGLCRELVSRNVEVLSPVDDFCLGVGNVFVQERRPADNHLVEDDTD